MVQSDLAAFFCNKMIAIHDCIHNVAKYCGNNLVIIIQIRRNRLKTMNMENTTISEPEML